MGIYRLTQEKSYSGDKTVYKEEETRYSFST